jgi:uncharacterized protein
MTTLSYVDSSALTKLVVTETESGGMFRWFIESERLASSRLAVIETRRAAARRNHDPAQLDRVLRAFTILEIDSVVAAVAAAVRPASVRTLDAIHLATALGLGDQLEAFVTYDHRLAEAARALGLPVVSPA